MRDRLSLGVTATMTHQDRSVLEHRVGYDVAPGPSGVDYHLDRRSLGAGLFRRWWAVEGIEEAVSSVHPAVCR